MARCDQRKVSLFNKNEDEEEADKKTQYCTKTLSNDWGSKVS